MVHYATPWHQSSVAANVQAHALASSVSLSGCRAVADMSLTPKLTKQSSQMAFHQAAPSGSNITKCNIIFVDHSLAVTSLVTAL